MSDIKTKIMGLLNISKDDAASEAEIETAVRLARRMMERHHLSEDDLVDSPEDQEQAARDAEKANTGTAVGRKIYRWEKTLAIYVRDLIGGIGCYTSGLEAAKTPAGLVIRDGAGRCTYSRHVYFYGIAEDVQTACRLYDELRTAVIALARIRYGSVYKGDGGRYAEGFIDGLQIQMEKETEQKKLAAGLQTNRQQMVLIERRNHLIRVKKQTAENWLRNSEGVKLRNSPISEGANGSESAFRSGRQDGASYNVNTARTLKIS